MNFWQFLDDSWGWLFLFMLCFGASILTWIGRQLTARRQHRERMARLHLEILREQNKLAEQEEQPVPKDDAHSEHSYLQGYEGTQQPMEMEMHYRDE